MTPSNDSAADVEEWTVIDTSNAQNTFTLTGLKPTEQYWVRYRAVSDVGVSEASDSVPFTFQGKLTVTVDQWNFSIPKLTNELRTEIMTTIGMSRWSPSTIKSEVTNIVNNPTIPYTGGISGGLREGMALYLQGVVSGNGFVSDFLTDPNGDCIRFNFIFWTFGLLFGPGCHRLTKESAFDMFFVKNTEGYENWSESTFGKELKTGISRTKRSDIQCDVPHPVCNPDKEYLGSIPGGLRHGVALFFQGVVPVDYVRFEINLQTGPKNPHDIALQLKRSMNSVVLNSCMNGTWGNEEEAPGGPFVRGAAFDIIMVITPECYEVMVNGLKYCKFEHRIPVDKVTTLNISGDVFMNTFGITKVDDINLKVTVTNPANI